MITDKYLIREQNEALMLNTIIRENEVSRAKISSITGLNKASVSIITKKLIEEELVIEKGEGESNKVGGRRPIILTFNQKSAIVLSMDVAPDSIEGILTYMDGEMLAHETLEDIQINTSNVFDYIVDMYNQLVPEDYTHIPHGIIGLSLAIHGIIRDTKISITPNYQIGNDFVEELRDYFSFPIYLENEGNLAALGEYCFSEESKHLVSLSIHSGIGSGYVQSGIVFQGSKGASGEIGHSVIVPNGKECPCGNKGCLEQYASQTVVFNQIKEVLNSNYVSLDEIVLLYRKDERIKNILNENAANLSIAINNICAIFDPEVIIINNAIYQAIPELINQIKSYLTGSMTKDIELRTSVLSNLATLYGGVANVIKHYLNIEDLKLLNNINLSNGQKAE